MCSTPSTTDPLTICSPSSGATLPFDTNQELSSHRITMERYEIPNEVPFPLRLHIVLSQVESLEQSHIVSWMPSGKSFRVHNREEFERLVLPEYFRSSNFRSFQRNLSVYQFNRIWSGPEKGAYYHEKFVRHDRTLCTLMKRNVTPRTTKKDQTIDEQIETTKSGKTVDEDKACEGDRKPAATDSIGEQDGKLTIQLRDIRPPARSITTIACPYERTQASHQRLDFLPPDQQESYRKNLSEEINLGQPSLELQGIMATAQQHTTLTNHADNHDDEDDPLLLDRLWSQTLDTFVASKNPSFTIRPTLFSEGGSSNFGSESEVSSSSSNRQLATTQLQGGNVFALERPNASLELHDSSQIQRNLPMDPYARIVFMDTQLQNQLAWSTVNVHSRGRANERNEPQQRQGNESQPPSRMGLENSRASNGNRPESPLPFPNNYGHHWWGGAPS